MYSDKALSSEFDASFAALCASADVGAYAGAYEPDLAVPEVPFADVLQGTPWASETASPAIPGIDVATPGHQAAQPALRAQLDNRGAAFPEEIGEEVEALRKSRSQRWKLKHGIARILRKPDHRKENGSTFSVCGCGYAATVFNHETHEAEPVSHVQLSRTSRGDGSYRVGVSGTLRCGSPWMCPTCAAFKAEERRRNVGEVIDRTSALGGVTAFVTLTVRHSLGQPLKDLKAIQSTASRKARQGRGWKEIQEEGGVLGVVQGAEVVHNDRTGWHYHSHLAVPCRGTPEEVLAAMRKFVARYIEEVGKLGGEALWQGQDIQLIDDSDADSVVAEYVSKGSASWEIAGSLKEARSKASKSPWDLAALAAAGDEASERLFVEYCHAMAGTRSCVISPKLAAALEMEVPPEETDEPTVAEDHEEEAVVTVRAADWRKLMSYSVAWQVIQAVETGRDGREVEAFVGTLVADIDRWESERTAKVKAAWEARKREQARVAADEVAAMIVSRRSMGCTWQQAEREAVRDIRRFRKDAVMPSKQDLGRAVSRELEARWGVQGA